MSRHLEFIASVSGDVAFDPNLSPTAKAVYLMLAMYRNADTHECYPSNKTLARGAGCSERTIIRALNELADAKVISREARFQDGRQINSITRLTDIVASRHGGHSRPPE